MKIEEMNFSVRVYNCLKRSRIDTVEQLQQISDDDLMKIRCFGIGCLKEVHQKLNRPAAPGPSDSDHDVMELYFRNGEQHMKEKIISMLMEHKTHVRGACHDHVVEIIKMVEAL